ncbi:MAG: hypothetical protein J6Y38_02200 [Bacteroidaceae bacterium]|nr:hypothetical protein [Bacteroidaceae bacterium]
MNKNIFLRMIVTLLVMVASIGAWAQYQVNLQKVQSVGIGYSVLPKIRDARLRQASCQGRPAPK